jgi:hypothetical protein
MKISTVFMLTVLAGISCNKEDDQSCSGPSLLYDTNWLLTDMGYDNDRDGIIETSLFTTISPCIQDDYYIFQCKETLVKFDNSIQCPGRDPVAEIHWRFISDSIFFIRDEGYRMIRELTPLFLQLKAVQNNGSPLPGGMIIYNFEKR